MASVLLQIPQRSEIRFRDSFNAYDWPKCVERKRKAMSRDFMRHKNLRYEGYTSSITPFQSDVERFLIIAICDDVRKGLNIQSADLRRRHSENRGK